ncbi:MAG: hypothetical protein CMH54_04985 [Myxococcales bacterium]|nr:hypothetical protein [Myxococcales bacterium]|tara:strand:- start:692 stop:1480 length:789 start_codon:yes stop_codon:yes gene_type:complete
MSQSIEIFREIVHAIEMGRPGVVATVLRHRGSAPGKEFHKMLVFEDGSFVGTIGGGKMEATVLEHCREVFESSEGKVVEVLIAEEEKGGIGGVCGGRAEVALELLPSVPRILLCGGGHCSVELGELIHQLGYLQEVHEDRPELVEADRFPHALKIHLGSPEDIVETMGDVARFSHVLLVSRGHATDRVYARALAAAGYTGWVGMLASKKKERYVRKLWLEEDGLDAEFVARVQAPVGLPIGARSPAEIAVSIMAQIVESIRG